MPSAETGTFEASLDEQSVATLLGIPGNLVSVTLERDVVTLSAGKLSVAAEVEARDGDVVVGVEGPLATLVGGATFPIDLSGQPGAPAAEDVDIQAGRMIVRGTLEEVQR